MKKSKSSNHESYSGYGTGEITIGKLLFYNVIFIAPMTVFFILSVLIASAVKDSLETSAGIAVRIIMIFFTLLLFFIIIPYIRRRESVLGVRYALVAFIIMAVGITIPSIILRRDFSLLIIELPHLASYILLTFIYTPEVLGMDIDISKWFKHYKQLLIILIYCSIVIFYVAGFAGIFYDIARENPAAFQHSVEKPASYSTYFYFSIISFATIGYGDITPVSSGARFLVCVEAIVGSIVNVIFIAILFVYVSNFQAFLQGLKEEEAMIEREEKEIKRLEKFIEKKRNKKKN